MHFISLSTLRIWLVICLAVVITACAPTTTVRRSPAYHQDMLTSRQILVLPARVENNYCWIFRSKGKNVQCMKNSLGKA